VLRFLAENHNTTH